MLDLVKSILDILTKGLYNPDLSKIKDKKKIGDIGSLLISLHAYINEILHNGVKIISLYDKYIYNYENGNHEFLNITLIKANYLIGEQIKSLQYISEKTGKIKLYLETIGKDLHIRLINVLGRKTDGLYGTYMRVSYKNNFLILDEDKDLRSKSGIRNLKETRDRTNILLYSLILNNGRESEYHGQVYDFLKFYILHKQSKKTLIYLKKLNDELRESIEKNFPKDDILLSINKKIDNNIDI